MQQHRRAAALAGACAIFCGLATTSFAQALPDGFVYLRDVDPSILQDIRYATPDNFTGHKLPGYEAAECIVKREVAVALSRVQQELKARGLSLKMYDCYRPARASRAMYAWSQEAAETAASRRHYPRLKKRDLFRLGYIAAYSGHSTGAAVDLTIVDSRAKDNSPFDPAAAYADCTSPADKRAPDSSIDMGTGYDCFDLIAYTRAIAISADQRKGRQTLLAAMTKQGFANYFREWWHFSLPRAGGPAQDFPIPPRSNR